MSIFTKLANAIFSPVNADGTARQIAPQDAQRWGTELERIILGLVAGELDIEFPYGFIPATNSGGGTANAIRATTALPIPTGDASALIALPIVAANTGPATVRFGNGAVLPIRSASNQEVVAGDLKAGSVVAGYVSNGAFRLLNDFGVQFLRGSVSGGSANSLLVSTPTEVPVARALVAFEVVAENTGAVTVSFNGRSAVHIIGVDGLPLSPGDLTAGMAVSGYLANDGFRLLSDPSSLRNKLAAEAAQSGAETAQEAAEDARDIAAGYASDAVSQGNVPIYATTVGMAELEVPAGINAIRVNGYAAAGDGGGALYKRVAAEPTHAGKFQSADGAWWELAELSPNVRMFGAKGDGFVDDTASIQEAVNYAVSRKSIIEFSQGVYLMRSVIIGGDLRMIGKSARILRPANFDVNNANELTAGIAHFDITSSNVNVDIEGLEFDGNESNQSGNDPSGISIRFSKVQGPITGSSQISIRGCKFVDQTWYAIACSGIDTSNERQTLVVENCTFLDGRHGLGRDDPASANVNGYTPFSIQLTDRITAVIKSNVFMFRKPIAVGQYAPCAVRMTFYDDQGPNDGASAIISGNRFYRMGRGELYYDGSSFENNGLGVIDFYARGREILISDNYFDTSFNSGIRGKSNVRNCVISANVLKNCFKAICITPAVHTPQVGNISITGNAIDDADICAIIVNGNPAFSPNVVRNVSITGNVIVGVTNRDSQPSIFGAIYLYYAAVAVVSGNTVRGAIDHGITARFCNVLNISNNSIENVGRRGIDLFTTTTYANVTGNSVATTGDSAILAAGHPTTANFLFANNVVAGAVDNGIIVTTACTTFMAIGNMVRGISGLGRGIVVPNYPVVGMIDGNVSVAPTPFLNQATQGNVKEGTNSWA